MYKIFIDESALLHFRKDLLNTDGKSHWFEEADYTKIIPKMNELRLNQNAIIRISMSKRELSGEDLYEYHGIVTLCLLGQI